MKRSIVLLLAVAACATSEPPQPPLQGQPASQADSVVPGTIGVVVQHAPAGVVVAAVGNGSPAAAAGLRVGDLVVRFNGVAVVEIRQFYRLMLESAPGSTVQLELMRDGRAHSLRIPVEQIDTTPRV